MTVRYPTLFSARELGPRTAQNRVWMTAHSTQLVKDHNFSDAHIAYYAERAKGGAGVITMEAMAVHPTTQPYEGKIFAFDERVVPNYRRLVEAVRPYGSLLLGQLWHRGRQTDSVVSRQPVWAPSAVPCTVYREMPHEMTSDEIAELLEGYVRSSEHCVEGDLDGVEIHGIAHGYLLGQFLSPATNHRTDAYGGSEENRFRLLAEIIEAVRAVVPERMICGIRINGDDGEVEGGLRNADWQRIARRIADLGVLDYVSVSQGTYIDRMRIYGASPTAAGYQLEDTARIKEAVPELPIVAVGRISTPEMAESTLANGRADFIGMARQLIADPYWPTKAQQEQDADIRPCVGANWCMSSIVKAPLACVHNPAVGREAELGEGTLKPTTQPRRVAVVGGGPGGLRAALTAAQRGHEVVLFERENELGGQVRWIEQATAYREWGSIVHWLAGQLERTDAKIETGQEVGSGDLAGFDAVVVATGSTPLRHGWSSLHPYRWGDRERVPGVDQWNVLTPQEVLVGDSLIGNRVMVFDDTGERAGVLIAEHLAEQRHPVEIVTRLPSVAPGLATSRDLGFVYKRLRKLGVVFTPNHEIAEIDEDRVTLRDVHTDDRVPREPVDTVVLVLGGRAEDALLRALRMQGVEAVGVGDCLAPRRIFNAIYEGELAARAL
jgi:2,4-dienoyl-CoA reductase-like NADH-dependent reductase (Old Yellow Enzyme family)